MEHIPLKTVRIMLRYAIHCMAVFLICYKIIHNGNSSLISCISLALTGILTFNDVVRNIFLSKKSVFWYYFSFTVSNILLGLLLYKYMCFAVQLYYVLLLLELAILNKKLPIPFVALNFFIFALILGVKSVNIKDILFSYSIMFLIIYIFRNILIEKDHVEYLNKELQNKNLILEELTINKERTRIAQELHDTIGHSLIALSMNLEYVENIIDKDSDKAKAIIKKSYDISKVSIINLRKAVNILKDENSKSELKKSINEIFEAFNDSGIVEYCLEMSKDIEETEPGIKDCIYKTVLETVTNGIKHGRASNFQINIHKEAEQIILIVNNNGKECNKIIKNNGITGIEKRISALGGKVEFSSHNGFSVKASIPDNSDSREGFC